MAAGGEEKWKVNIPDNFYTHSPNFYFISQGVGVRRNFTPKQVPKSPLDPEKLELAKHDYPMAWVGRTDVRIGDVAKCSAYPVYHPGHFNVTLRSNSRKLEKFEEEWCEFYKEHADNDRYKLIGASYRDFEGLYVAVPLLGKWHRGYIMKCFKESTKKKPCCKVLIIDHGDHKNIMLDLIRKIPEIFLSHLPAQAIKCSLQFDGNATSLNLLDGLGTNLWTIKEAEAFLKEDKPTKTGIFLLEFVYFKDEANLPNPIVWKCRVRRDLSTKETVVDEIQMADMFLKQLADKNVVDQEDDTATDDRCELSHLEPWKFLESCSISHLENSTGINVLKTAKPFIFTD